MDTIETSINAESSLPVLLSIKDADKLGLSRSAFYRLMNRADVPRVTIGARIYLHRDRFLIWLDEHIG